MRTKEGIEIMPYETFFRLSAEKQDRICNAALKEFIEYKDNYNKAGSQS